jgi:glycine cleavage system H protein
MVKIDNFEVIEDVYYSKDWMWIQLEKDEVKIGLTDYAQQQMNELVFIELPEVGDDIIQGETYGTVESVKSVSDLIAPISGKIVKINEEVLDNPELINQDPFNEGWLIIVKSEKLQEELKKLMAYKEAVKWHRELLK